MDAKYLAEIKARAQAELPETAAPVFRDRYALVAEVERLTAENQGLRANSMIQEHIISGGYDPIRNDKIVHLIMDNAAKDQQIATLKGELKAAKEDIHAMNTLCLTEGGCCSCCGNQNDALLDCACDFCKKSGVGCWVQDKDDSERCAAFEWRGVHQAQEQEADHAE